MIGHRWCRHCGKDYSYEGYSVNIMTFCPHCLRFDHLECEYGYGHIVPCQILLGEQPIGVIYISDGHYHLESLYLDINIVLKDTGIKALEEAEKIVSQALQEKYREQNK